MFVADNDPYGDIASGFEHIDDSLVDDLVPDTGINSTQANAEAEEPQACLQQYLRAVKSCIVTEIKQCEKPACYQQGSFFDRPMQPVFAMKNDIATVGLTASTFYQHDVFFWLPHLLPGQDRLKCVCGNLLSSHGMT